MSNGLKSARDLAMERTEKLHQEEKASHPPLTEEQKTEISEVEKEYTARAAEKEVMLESKMKQLLLQGNSAEAVEAAMQLKALFEKEKEAIREEKERQIEAIRQRHP